MRRLTPFRYGTQAMIQLAKVDLNLPLLAREMPEEQRISPKYPEHILNDLKAASLVQAVRGKQRGYVLTRAPGRIRRDAGVPRLSQFMCDARRLSHARYARRVERANRIGTNPDKHSGPCGNDKAEVNLSDARLSRLSREGFADGQRRRHFQWM